MIASAWERPDVHALAERARAILDAGLAEGQRAVLVHDLDAMLARFRAYRAAFPPGTLHAVAIKANPLVGVLRVLVEEGAGLEAASYEEVALALAAGCPPERVVFDSPAKTEAEIRAALELGVLLNADSLDEVARIAAAWRPGHRSQVGLRVNPGIGAGRIATTSVAHATSKFGEPIGEDPAPILAAFRRHPWLVGLHVHAGSQGLSVDRLVEAAAVAEGLRRKVDAALGSGRVAFVDVGGGLPVAYRTGDEAPAPAALVEGLARVCPGLLDGVRLVTEPGRSLHAPCGFALSRVEAVKHPGGADVVVHHLGADLLLRAVYRPAEWPHELAALDPRGNPREGEATPWIVPGPLCFGGDVLGPLPLVAPRVGDWLLIRDIGAYTLSMWSRHCSRGIPLVLGIEHRPFRARVLRAAEAPDDVVRFWSPPDPR